MDKGPSRLHQFIVLSRDSGVNDWLSIREGGHVEVGPSNCFALKYSEDSHWLLAFQETFEISGHKHLNI